MENFETTNWQPEPQVEDDQYTKCQKNLLETIGIAAFKLFPARKIEIEFDMPNPRGMMVKYDELGGRLDTVLFDGEIFDRPGGPNMYSIIDVKSGTYVIIIPQEVQYPIKICISEDVNQWRVLHELSGYSETFEQNKIQRLFADVDEVDTAFADTYADT
jgi:hypothetical protein